jgi:hypothetical protein
VKLNCISPKRCVEIAALSPNAHDLPYLVITLAVNLRSNSPQSPHFSSHPKLELDILRNWLHSARSSTLITDLPRQTGVYYPAAILGLAVVSPSPVPADLGALRVRSQRNGLGEVCLALFQGPEFTFWEAV